MSGEKTALALALEARPPDDAEDEQLDLIGIVSDEVIALRAERDGKNPRHRPKGSRNRRTLEMAKFLLTRYTSPLEVLAQISNARVDELAVSLGCTKLEALQEIRLASVALKDHLHSKMPVAVDVTNTKIVHLTIHEGEPVMAGQGDDEVLTLTGTVLSASSGGNT